MPKRVVINYAQDSWYPDGQLRLAETLREFGGDPETLFFNRLPAGCPGGPRSMTAKFHAARWARRMGADTILWMDAAAMTIRDLLPIWEAIERDGAGIWLDPDWSCGQWASDAALAALKVTRDDAIETPFAYCAVMGFDLRSARGSAFYHAVQQAVDLGGLGPDHDGPHTPANQVSLDDRVLGFRRDGPMVGLLARQYDQPGNLNEFCCLQANYRGHDIIVARGGCEWPWREWARQANAGLIAPGQIEPNPES